MRISAACTVLLAVATATVPFSNSARATPIVTDVSISGGYSGEFTSAGIEDVPIPGESAGVATVSAGLSPPTATASVLNPTGLVSVYVQYLYYYEVVGTANTLVPITTMFSLSSSISGSGDALSYAFLTGQGITGSSIFFEGCSTNISGACADVTVSGYSGFQLNGSVISNTVYGIELFTQASYDGSGGPGSASATVDPVITVNQPGFSLILSPGVVNSVPEPFTLSLFGTGLVGAAALRRRKARKT